MRRRSVIDLESEATLEAFLRSGRPGLPVDDLLRSPVLLSRPALASLPFGAYAPGTPGAEMNLDQFVAKHFPHKTARSGAKLRLATSREANEPNTFAVDFADGTIEFVHGGSDEQVRALKDLSAAGETKADFFAALKAPEPPAGVTREAPPSSAPVPSGPVKPGERG